MHIYVYVYIMYFGHIHSLLHLPADLSFSKGYFHLFKMKLYMYSVCVWYICRCIYMCTGACEEQIPNFSTFFWYLFFRTESFTKPNTH